MPLWFAFQDTHRKATATMELEYVCQKSGQRSNFFEHKPPTWLKDSLVSNQTYQKKTFILKFFSSARSNGKSKATR